MDLVLVDMNDNRVRFCCEKKEEPSKGDDNLDNIIIMRIVLCRRFWGRIRSWHERYLISFTHDRVTGDISAKIENDMILFGKIENGHPTWSFSILPNRICHACVVLQDEDDVVALEC